MVTLKRYSYYADKLRVYRVLLDNVEIATIGDGEIINLNIPDGDHKLQLKIDWASSDVLSFTKNSLDIQFECGSNLSGFKVWFALFYIVFLPHKYLWIKVK